MHDWKSEIRERLSGLKLEPVREAAIVEELAQHLEDCYVAFLAGGSTPTEAERRARAELVDRDLLARELRRIEHQVTREPVVPGGRKMRMLGDLWQDVRYGFRMLLKHPGFTTVAVLTIALGIGANTAIFSLIDAVLLKMLPVQHPEELVEIGRSTDHGPATSFSYPAFEQFRDRNQSLSGVLTVSKTPLHMTGDGDTDSPQGQYVSGNFFSLLGVEAWLGRTITPQDDMPSGADPSVAVISHGLWQRRFGGEPSIVGRQIAVEEKPFTIIGVAPPEFFGLQPGSAPDFWIPIAAEPLIRPRSWLKQGDFNWLSVVGRLKPGASTMTAQSDLEVIFSQVLEERSAKIHNEHDRQTFLSQRIGVEPAANGLSRLRQQFSKPLLILMTLVGLVLLIACANIASLLMARASSRRRELAVRLALGASRSRLVRQLLTESVILAFIGGLAGLLFSFWAGGFLVAFMSSGETRIFLPLQADISILGFTTLTSLLTGLLFGLAPAFNATRIDPGPTLKEHAPALGGGRSGGRLGKSLVVLQVALSLVLVAGAGLFAGSLRNLQTLDAGFSRENVLMINLNPGKAGYKDARLAGFYEQAIERASLVPGVRSVSLSRLTPISGGGWDLPASVEGYTPQPNEDPTVYVNGVSPGYFETLGTTLLLGRDFAKQDRQNTPKVALINETMMKHYFPGADPIGRRVTLGGREAMEIIGVVKDARYMSLREEIHRTVYVNCLQDANLAGSLTLEVQSIGDPSGIIAPLRNEIGALDSSVPLTGFGTLAKRVDESLIQERLVATLSGFFGGLALLLACIGLYGVMSCNVARRTSEIGIRLALGAGRANILWIVLRECLLLVSLGIAIGAPVALAAGRLAASEISGLLFGLSATDASTILLAALALTGVAMLAVYLPARRAMKVDPIVSLRYE